MSFCLQSTSLLIAPSASDPIPYFQVQPKSLFISFCVVILITTLQYHSINTVGTAECCVSVQGRHSVYERDSVCVFVSFIQFANLCLGVWALEGSVIPSSSMQTEFFCSSGRLKNILPVVVHTSTEIRMDQIIEVGLWTSETPKLSTVSSYDSLCVWVCLCETNLFVFGLTSHQHLQHVAHRISSHWWDGLPCDLTHVSLQLVHSGSCWRKWKYNIKQIFWLSLLTLIPLYCCKNASRRPNNSYF